MTQNIGKTDRIIRITLAVVALLLAFGTGFGAAGVIHWILIAVAVIALVTAVAGTCPLYRLIGMNTCKIR